jgi:phosphoserine/homoserine phosphotransferase
MLTEADVGLLFHAPQNVIDEFPQFQALHDFPALKAAFLAASERSLAP